jgi:hypothetical protein
VSTVPPLLRSLGEHRCSVLGITFPVETEITGSTSSKKLLVDSGGGEMSNVFFWGYIYTRVDNQIAARHPTFTTCDKA